DAAEHSGDTLGGEFEVLADNLPPGLGSYAQWDSRLDGRLARALMSIPAVKAVSLGEGIQAASKKGSQVHDPIVYDKGNKSFSRTTNNAGGIEGGMTNGELLRIHGFMKPIATLKNPLSSVDMNTKAPAGASTERSDVTAVPACGVIGESVVALELACAMLEKFGGDSIEETKRNFNAYLAAIKEM
ncbi:MAG: chorismate synthase, partial [Candidatus Omnitrophica bacterium]|nr:chorismate synthase [Candidatus Omnitrophota bacterium]